MNGGPYCLGCKILRHCDHLDQQAIDKAPEGGGRILLYLPGAFCVGGWFTAGLWGNNF